MQTKNKPSGWLKLFLFLSISGGILISLFSLLAITTTTGIGFLCCGALMVIFGCCAWSAYKKGLPAALSFSRGCVVVFFLLMIFVFSYCFIDGIIYDKIDSFYLGIIAVIFLMTIIWCGAWLWYLSQSKQVRRLVTSTSGGSKTVKTTIVVLAFGLLICSTVFYIKESNVHYSREMRYLADQLKATQKSLDEVDEDDVDEEESIGTVDYTGNGYKTAKTTNSASTSKRKTESEKSNEANSPSSSNTGYKRMDIGVATISIPNSYTCTYDKDDESYAIADDTNLNMNIFPKLDLVSITNMETYKILKKKGMMDLCERIANDVVEEFNDYVSSVKVVDHRFYQSKGHEILCITSEVVYDGIKGFVKLYLIRSNGRVGCTVSVVSLSNSESQVAKQIVESIVFK